LQKTDIFKRIIWWSYTTEPDVFIPLSIKRVKEIMELNAKGEKPDDLAEAKDYSSAKVVVKEPDFQNVVGQDSLTRFDARKNQNKNKNKKPQHNKGGQQGGNKKPNNQQQAQGNKQQNSANKPNNQQQNKGQQQGQGNKQNAKPNPNKPQHKHQHKPNPNKGNQQKGNNPNDNKPKDN